MTENDLRGVGPVNMCGLYYDIIRWLILNFEIKSKNGIRSQEGNFILRVETVNRLLFEDETTLFRANNLKMMRILESFSLKSGFDAPYIVLARYNAAVCIYGES